MNGRAKELQLDLLAAHEPDQQFLIRESKRARKMAINIGPHGDVEIVVPRNSRPKIVQAFVSRHQSWIDKALRSLDENRPDICRDMPDRIELNAVGREWNVAYGSRRLREENGLIRVPAEQQDRLACRRHLHLWLKRTARQFLIPRLEVLALDNGFSFKRVQVRGQKTRWGSYSTSGTLSLNFCLLFLRPELVTHLMFHELCHTRVMSHSQKFWRLLERYQPEYREHEHGLDKGWMDVPGWVGLH